MTNSSTKFSSCIYYYQENKKKQMIEPKLLFLHWDKTDTFPSIIICSLHAPIIHQFIFYAKTDNQPKLSMSTSNKDDEYACLKISIQVGGSNFDLT